MKESRVSRPRWRGRPWGHARSSANKEGYSSRHCPRQEHRPQQQQGCIFNVRNALYIAFPLRSRRPAQILSKAAARQHLGGVPHKSSQDTPVIFFGTSEIAWIGAKDVTAWESGMGQSFCAKGRKNKKFVVALEQVSTC
mgnify:CR=1 FL=1